MGTILKRFMGSVALATNKAEIVNDKNYVFAELKCRWPARRVMRHAKTITKILDNAIAKLVKNGNKNS